MTGTAAAEDGNLAPDVVIVGPDGVEHHLVYSLWPGMHSALIVLLAEEGDRREGYEFQASCLGFDTDSVVSHLEGVARARIADPCLTPKPDVTYAIPVVPPALVGARGLLRVERGVVGAVGDVGAGIQPAPKGVARRALCLRLRGGDYVQAGQARRGRWR